MLDAAKSKAEQKWAIENQSSIMPEDYVVSSSEDFKNIMKKRSSEVRNSDASSDALQNTNKQRWRDPLRYCKSKTRHACIVEADESTRIRLEGVLERCHEGHIAAKGINSLSGYNLVHKFIPMPQAF